MKNINVIKILIIILDIIILGYLIFKTHVDESVSLWLVFIVFYLIIINSVLWLVTFFVKKDYAYLFLANMIWSSLIAVVLFYIAINYYKNVEIKNKTFHINSVNFYIHFYNNTKEFELTNSNNDSIIDGNFLLKSDTIILKTNDKKTYFIVNDSIHNFEKSHNIRINNL